ncbi:MAG TPA: hypothetical protein VHE35_23310 [Kofleriaceae bacterium]|nr:hypothetical protein [Kofleriaceae bacterium]
MTADDVDAWLVRCPQQSGAAACCADGGLASACVAAGRLTARADEARAFDVCHLAHATSGDAAGRCWAKLPARALAEGRAICAAGSDVWCGFVEAGHRQRAADATLVVSAVAAAACLVALVLRRRAAR